MKKILLVEDEPAVASLVRRGLTEKGYEVTVAMDGKTGLDMMLNNTFDLILLDIMLPGINGIELCRRLRIVEKVLTPVIMLTALGTTENIVTGLDSGADDYLVKPFKLAELEARIRTLLRRSGTPTDVADILQLNNLELNLTAKTVNRNGQPIPLTATEFRLLEFLLRNKKRVISRIEILEHVWGIDFNMGTNVVDVYVNYLRKKIDKDFEPKLIHTVVGMGYVIKETA